MVGCEYEDDVPNIVEFMGRDRKVYALATLHPDGKLIIDERDPGGTLVALDDEVRTVLPL